MVIPHLCRHCFLCPLFSADVILSSPIILSLLMHTQSYAGLFVSFGWATIVTFATCVAVLLIGSMDRRLVASLIVTGLMVLVILGFIGLVTGGFYMEGKRISESVVTYLQTDQVQTLLNNRERSPLYLWALEKFESFGFNTSLLDPTHLQDEVLSLPLH